MADVVVFTRGTGRVEVGRDEAKKICDWATEGPDEQGLHRTLERALEVTTKQFVVVLADDCLYALREALFRVLNVIEEKDPPLTPPMQQLRELTQRPLLP